MPARTSRRTFLKLSTAAASLGAAELAHAAPASVSITLILDPASPLTTGEPVQWASDKLRAALTAKGVGINGTKPALTIVAAPADSPLAKDFTKLPSLTLPETTALIPGRYKDAPAILVTGIDARGLTFGLTELAERVRLEQSPMAALHLPTPLVETTPNKVRSVARAFISEIEDKSWFYDRAFWIEYLDTLAAARFNRFNFALGFGYDFPRGVTGDYLHFPYPYLVEVPGYEQVHVEPLLPPGERQRNLETLQFIAAETARRGLDFQLGIWTHAYAWTDSPHSDHHIVGLTPETHAAYCRDALAAILKACPQITGLTMRIHGESGIPEGSYPFWQTLFEAVPKAGRTINLDLHAKGLDQTMIDIALKTGMPVDAGAKFWAEHQGLAYHQADIRAYEYPRTGVTGTFALSNGARNFTRYGYGDFYQQGSRLDVLYRVWPGTQRHLLWGDPALAAGYGRIASFCGAAGMEICEPLTFKGREGSGRPGGRDAYADSTLASSTLDTAKYAVTFLLWGRYLYNPDTPAEVHHRYLLAAFGPAGPGLEVALANSSRILPLVTTAWLPSASNHELWVENITPVSILPYTGRPLFTDSPVPHNVSVISPLDPQLFTTIEQHAKDLVSGTKNARYNSSEVIQWIEASVRTSKQALAAARAAAGAHAQTPEFRRAEEDILILNGVGTYYANLFRAALFYSLRELTGDPAFANRSLAAYRVARDAWATMATRAKTVYAGDISYGRPDFRRGNWADRLPAIDQDIAALEKHFGEPVGLGILVPNGPVTPVARPVMAVKHTAPDTFHPGADLPLAVVTPPSVTEAVLWYRHVNHGERWLSTPMQRQGTSHTAVIPAAYTDSPFPLQHYFELQTATAATLHPAFNPTLSNQPYFAVYKRT